MTEVSSERRDLRRLAASLESLRSGLQQDLAAMRQLPERDLVELLRAQTTRSRARSTQLWSRLVALREIAEVRCRELCRLRARMHQLRGGARPH